MIFKPYHTIAPSKLASINTKNRNGLLAATRKSIANAIQVASIGTKE